MKHKKTSSILKLASLFINIEKVSELTEVK